MAGRNRKKKQGCVDGRNQTLALGRRDGAFQKFKITQIRKHTVAIGYKTFRGDCLVLSSGKLISNVTICPFQYFFFHSYDSAWKGVRGLLIHEGHVLCSFDLEGRQGFFLKEHSSSSGKRIGRPPLGPKINSD